MNLRDKVVTAHQYFHRKIFNTPNYKFNPSDKQARMISNFCTMLLKEYKTEASIGNKLITDYFAYQHLRWIGKTDTVFGNSVMLGWLIGKKAFNSWKSKAEGSLHIAREKVLFPFKINANEVFGVKSTLEYMTVEVYEENIKHQFQKEESLLGHCIEQTSLYNKRSKYCISCKWRAECKEVQKQIYPAIYSIRNATKDRRVQRV